MYSNFYFFPQKLKAMVMKGLHVKSHFQRTTETVHISMVYTNNVN